MKPYAKYTLLALVVLLALSLVVCGNLGAPAQAVKPPTKTPIPPTITPAPWVLTWSDEFDGPEVNLDLWWIYEGPSPRNNEENYYTHEDVYIENGELVMRQQQRDFGSGADLRHYTSGQVISRYDVGPLTGRVEVRGKPSTEQGFHSAYWTYDTVNWPPEIDILEVIGSKPYQAFMAWHWGTYPNDGGTSGVWNDPAGDLDLNYHVYTIEYDFNEGYIRWFIDGVERFDTNQNLDQLETMPMRVLLDTAIGGDWEGDPDGTTVWPGYNRVDYVRVYQRAGVPITPTPVTATPPPTDTPIPPPSATPSNDPQLNRVAAVASSEESAEVSADKAIDGSMTTRWGSEYSDPQWIYVDLGETKWVSRVMLHWEAACGKAYEIQVSDNTVDWTTVRSLGLQDGGTDDITAIDTNARYVRMYGIERCLPYGFSLYEFEVYGQDTPPPTITPGGPTDTPIPPTDTPLPTNTPGGPTDTPVPTDTPAPTSTPGGGGGTIFYDNFEDGDINGWTISGGDVMIRTDQPYEGTYCIGAKRYAWFSRTISTAGYTNIHVKYAAITSNLSAGDHMLAEWYDGSTWHTLEQLDSTGYTHVLRDWTLPAGAADNGDFALRFTANADKNTEWFWADIIEVTSE